MLAQGLHIGHGGLRQCGELGFLLGRTIDGFDHVIDAALDHARSIAATLAAWLRGGFAQQRQRGNSRQALEDAALRQRGEFSVRHGDFLEGVEHAPDFAPLV